MHGHKVDFENLPETQRNHACARHTFAIDDDVGATA